MTLKIIDVYSGDGVGVVDAVKNSIDGVIVKATEGLTYDSPTFAAQCDATLRAGKLLGCYHFARSNDAVAEAGHFVNVCAPYMGQAILALDLEGDALKNGTAWAKRFLDRVYERTGVRPLLYIQQSKLGMGWDSVVKAGYDLWVARYRSRSHTTFGDYDSGIDPSPWPYIAIWQFSETGRLPGFSGNLDLNYAFMSRDAWGRYAKAKEAPKPRPSTSTLENSEYRVTIERK